MQTSPSSQAPSGSQGKASSEGPQAGPPIRTKEKRRAGRQMAEAEAETRGVVLRRRLVMQDRSLLLACAPASLAAKLAKGGGALYTNEWGLALRVVSAAERAVDRFGSAKKWLPRSEGVPPRARVVAASVQDNGGPPAAAL